MPDKKIADEWSRVSSEQESKLRDLESQFESATEQKDALITRQVDLFKQRRQPGVSAEEIRQINQELISTSASIDQLTSTQGQLANQISATNVAILGANRSSEQAEDSPRGTINNPTTQSTPAPANPDPGDNTDVPPPQAVTQISPIDQELLTFTGDGVPVADPVPPGEELPPSNPDVLRIEALRVNNEQAQVNQARASGNEGRYEPFPEVKDYRVRISLAPSADYLYMDPNIQDDYENLLFPLIETGGVIFPYTPNISVNYSASYSPTELTHTNYKIYNYTGSGVDSLQITGDFTAQDVVEANYVLAVIHFFRSVTKMFYGRDQNKGVPPPLVYLSGHGEYGFNSHPMVITSFTLNYPTDVDYINAGPTYNIGAALNPYRPPNLANNPSRLRLRASNLQIGGVQAPPTFGVKTNSRTDITRVPTRLQISISANPIVTRNSISNIFSLKEYATGKLLRGNKNPRGGGIW